MNRITDPPEGKTDRMGVGLAPTLAMATVLLAVAVVSVDVAGSSTRGQSYFEVGRLRLAEGQSAQALPLLAAATVTGPNVQAARPYLLGVLNQQCFDLEVAGFEAALPVLPHYPPLLECLGRRYEGMGHYTKAEALYLRWVDVDEGLVEPYARLGELYDQTGDHAHALAAFNRHRRMGGSGYAERRMAAIAAAQVEALRPLPVVASQATPVPNPRRLAAGPDVQAQLGLGVRYEYGLGVPVDATLAAEAYTRAAQAGDAFAQLRLALLLQEGHGVPRDPEEAVVWLSRAAAGGLPEAQFHLALACLRGVGLPHDVARAVALSERAAARGLPEAQFLLGTLYRYGIGVATDRRAAVDLFIKAGAAFLKHGRQEPARQALAASFEAEGDG